MPSVAAFSRGSVRPGLIANCAPAAVTSASCCGFSTVPAPTMASGTSLAIARIASIAQAVRNVTSSTRTPPATSAFAIGTACSSLFTTITGTTGPVVRIASALVFQFFIRVFLSPDYKICLKNEYRLRPVLRRTTVHAARRTFHAPYRCAMRSDPGYAAGERQAPPHQPTASIHLSVRSPE